MSFEVVITDAGRAEIINAENTGTGPVEITQIGFGSGQYSPASSQTALQNETKRISTISGEVVAADTIHVIVQDETQDEYDVGEFGLFTNSGTLLAVYSQPSAQGWIIEKSPASTLLLAVDIILTTIDATSLTFGDASFLNPPATESTPGVILRASEPKALEGTDDLAAMTPQKVFQAFQQFGLGDISTQLPGDNLDDNTIPPGVGYRVDGNTTGTKPEGSSGQGHLYVAKLNSNQATQFFFDFTTGVLYTRANPTGTGWTSWRRVFTNTDTATQSDAETGTENTKVMTPLRVSQYVEQFGLPGALELTSSDDFNAVSTTGIYRFDAGGGIPANAPPTVTYGFLFSFLTGPRAVQVVYDREKNKAYMRTYFSTTWTSWIELFGGNSIASQPEAEAGAINDKPMTPLRVKQAYGQHGLGISVPLDSVPLFKGSRIKGWNSDAPDAPSGGVWVGLDLGYAANRRFQIAISTSNAMFFRGGSTEFVDRTAWSRVFNDNDVPTQTEAEAGTIQTKAATPLSVKQYVDQFGIGNQITETELNADLYRTAGIFVTPSSGHLNFPNSGNNSRALMYVGGGQNYLFQIVQQRTAPYRRFFRACSSGDIEITPWNEVFGSNIIASQAQAEAGSDNSTPMTPLRVAQAIAAQSIARSEFGGTRATNGYQRIPGNGVADLIIQWGTVTSFGSDNQSVTFPISFPNACLNITTGMKSNQILNANVGAHSYSTTGFTILNDGRYHTAWLAIGY